MTSRKRTRARLLLVVVVVTLCFAIMLSCQPRSLDLGSRDTVVEEASTIPIDVVSEPEPEAAAPTLEDRLKARCALPPGLADRYTSAADLTTHVVGRWYLCGDPAASPLEDPDGVQLRIDGTWSILRFDNARESLAPSTDPDQNGTYNYYAYSDADAGTGADGGGGPKIIPLNETVPRASIFIYLHRPISTDFVITVDFDNPPHRMLMRDVGESAHSAFYVSTDGE